MNINKIIDHCLVTAKSHERIKEVSFYKIHPYLGDDYIVIENMLVKGNSRTLKMFKKNNSCVCCGLTGTTLAIHGKGKYRYFNLYADTKAGQIMMTLDHIIPRSKGGIGLHNNRQTMCNICNLLKGNDKDVIGVRKELSRNKNIIRRYFGRVRFNKIGCM